jgi:hypothetical protein
MSDCVLDEHTARVVPRYFLTPEPGREAIHYGKPTREQGGEIRLLTEYELHVCRLRNMQHARHFTLEQWRDYEAGLLAKSWVHRMSPAQFASEVTGGFRYAGRCIHWVPERGEFIALPYWTGHADIVAGEALDKWVEQLVKLQGDE